MSMYTCIPSLKCLYQMSLDLFNMKKKHTHVYAEGKRNFFLTKCTKNILLHMLMLSLFKHPVC